MAMRWLFLPCGAVSVGIVLAVLSWQSRSRKRQKKETKLDDDTNRGGLAIVGWSTATNRLLFQRAIAAGDVEGLDELCKKNPEFLNEPGDMFFAGWAPVHVAAMYGRNVILRVLLDAGANVDIPSADGSGTTALYVAIFKGHAATSQLIFSYGAVLPEARGMGLPLLHGFAVAGNGNSIRVLVNKLGVDVDIKSADGSTALMYSILNKRLGTVSLLIELGANPYIKNSYGSDAMQYAVSSGDAMVVQTLAACGVDMNYKDETSGIRPIDFAAASGNAGVLRVFLNSGSHTSANLEEKCYLSEHPADCLSLLRAVKVAQTAATAGNLDWICSEVATGTIATPAQWMHLLSSEKAQKLLAWTAAAISDGKACFLALYGAARRETPKHISPLLIMQSSPLSLCRNGSFPRAALKTVHPSCLLLHNGITGVQQLIISCLSEFCGTIVAYALRAPPSAAVDPGASSSSSWGAATSATKAKLDAFHCLPEMPDGHRPRAPAATLLVLRGVNDRPIHAFHSLAGVLAFVQAAGAGSELCRWHFVECPTRGVKAIPAECKLTPDLTPAGMFANDVADYIQ
jgi:ankyrin repeat protein